MKALYIGIFLLQLLVAGQARSATDQVWLVGGGPDLFGSQVQIERNVLWALEVIEGLPGQRTVEVWFTDGADPHPDVFEWAPAAETAAAMQPLARVFDSYWSNGERYRNHRIPAVAGSTRADLLAETLGARLRALRAGDGTWLIFNGHGSHQPEENNRIELWDGSWLNVADLRTLLDQGPESVRLRFLFTQCYAGAFADLAAPGHDRCGFLAEAPDRDAEGCSAAIDRSGYQDYSTHFFAALAGRGRDGAPLGADPDRDGDGRVSPLEAHFHVLASAFSGDIPRATSEVLLERWRPGLLARLWAGGEGRDNDYTRLARGLMAAAGIGAAADPEAEIERRMTALARELERLEGEQERLLQAIDELRKVLEYQVLRRWPRAAYPYTRNFREFLEQDLDRAQDFILAHPDYPELVRRQRRYWTLDDLLLDAERRYTRLEKIGHLLRLGWKKAALERAGPEALRARYRALRECEAAPF